VYCDRVVRIEYSKLSAKHHIRAWGQLLALCAGDPTRQWGAVTVARSEQAGVKRLEFTAVPAEVARDHLEMLVRIYRLGLTQPLPAPPKTAFAYAERRSRGFNPANSEQYAKKQWDTKGQYDDLEHRRVGFRTFDDLTADAPLSQLGSTDEPHLFGQLSCAIWTPLLEALATP
jgi:exodeoxyribonuclease V gamma subunit